MNKTVVITGAARGIGAAAALKLAGDGYNVAVCCHKNADKAQKIAEKIGSNAKVYCFDVADIDACESAVSEILHDFGAIYALVNNAGIALYKMVNDTTDADVDSVMNVNFKGTFNMTKAVLPAMIGAKRGSIVNVSSMWGVTGGSCESVYSASKAAVIGFTKAVAKEVGLSGIRVNCVAPGVILTDMTANLSSDDLSALKDETPLNRIGTPEDVADTIGFLVSDNARFITGQVLNVDGGMVI